MREFLDEDKPLALRTFEAQERHKRENGAASEGHGDPSRNDSVRATRRGLRGSEAIDKAACLSSARLALRQ